MGFEPTTSAVTGRRSNQLSHRAISCYIVLTLVGIVEWTFGDLNPGPTGYEPDELPDCSIPRYIYLKPKPMIGLEPITC